MGHKSTIIALLSLWLFVSVQVSYADKEFCGPFFDSQVPGKVDIIPSGRDAHANKILEDASVEIFGPGGVAQRLGLALPHHQVTFMSSSRLAQMATLGRQAIGHWHDGAQLVNAFRSAGVLEFVTGGCPTCRSFYTDTTSLNHQISILMHVAGHNNFSARSVMARIRGVDVIAESENFENYLLHLEQSGEASSDEVQQWYQYLLSARYLQDMIQGTFQAPSEFDPERAYGKDGRRLPIPRQPTPSVLQALVANLPPSAPAWKRRIAKYFERMNRIYGWYASDKIMNEGHATQMQEILAAHSSFVTDEHLLDFADLLRGVVGVGINLGNPYWLGREAWRALRQRFNDQTEIRGLAPLERDQRFIAYANTLIEQLHDVDFLRLALDERFIADHKLYLTRRALPDEMDPTKPWINEKGEVQYVVVTRDPRRVANWIIRNVADRRRSIPQILLESMNAGGRGVVSLNHKLFDSYPLKQDTAAQTLFVLARVMERPVSLKTKFGTEAVRIEVDAEGKVTVYLRDAQTLDHEQVHEHFTETCQEAVNNYRDESMGMLGPDLTQFEKDHFGPIAAKVLDKTLETGMPHLTHSPGAARALFEYSRLAKSRFARALRLLAEGKLKFRSSKKGIRIQLLPPIPEFEFDDEAIEIIESNRPPERIDEGLNPRPVPVHGGKYPGPIGTLPSMEEGGIQQLLNTATTVGTGDGNPGDIIWGPDSSSGKGKGKKGNPGDDDDTGDPARGRGGKSNDPLQVDIDFDTLNEILDLELPNRKSRTGGDIEAMDRVREGGTQRQDGEVLWARMMPKIIATGYQVLLREWKKLYPDGQNPPAFATKDKVRAGMRLITPEDYIVQDHDIVPRPESKAVFVVIMDQSGSMHGRPQELIKQFYNSTLRLLRKKYKTIEVVFIGFNESVALEMTEKQFFGTFLSGGDEYILGWRKATEVVTREKYKEHDKFAVLAGDFWSRGGDDVTHAMKTLYSHLNWGAAILTDLHGSPGEPTLIEPIKELAAREKFFDFGRLQDSAESQIQLLIQFFKRRK